MAELVEISKLQENSLSTPGHEFCKGKEKFHGKVNYDIRRSHVELKKLGIEPLYGPYISWVANFTSLA